MTQTPPTSYDRSRPPARKQHWFARNWKWFVPLLVGLFFLLAVGLCAGIFATILGGLKNSVAYTQSLALVQSSDQVKAQLGEPIEPSWWLVGAIEIHGEYGEANFTYEVSGPNGTATVDMAATRIDGNWSMDWVNVIFANGQTIDLIEGQLDLDPDVTPDSTTPDSPVPLE